MAKEKRHKRRDSPEVKTKVKQEKLSPARPHKTRRSPNDNRRRASRSPVRTRDDRSAGRRETSSPGRRGSRSPRRRSPHRSADVKLKRERDEQRSGGEEQRRRNEQPQERRGRGELERPHESDRNGDRRRERDATAAASQQAERRHHDEQRREKRRRREENQEVDFGHPEGAGDSPTEAPADKEKPNFGLSGALTEDTNTFRGVVIKYNEPPEARIPKRRWRLYPFKNDEQLPVMYIHRQSAYLLGRQRKIADIPIDHPSCSKQHAVFQYRVTEFTRADGTTGRRVRPYIIDLASGNGTYLNNQRIEAQRYYELKEKDVLKFGFSSREYVLLHEFSDTSEVDAKQEPEEEDEGLDE